ncbi:MAG TPA: response regulator [Candidatus Methanoperedens sp.]|nr:response regulator [Candidatus Methanoperedens sp.]
MTVLIVDDNDTNRKLCRALLEQSGYRTREAANGYEGLQVVRSELPELILMDVQMPALDGVEALKRLKDDPATRNIPVVALTSYAMKGDREKFLVDGFSDYLSKPIDIDRFLEVVRRLAPLPPSPP